MASIPDIIESSARMSLCEEEVQLPESLKDYNQSSNNAASVEIPILHETTKEYADRQKNDIKNDEKDDENVGDFLKESKQTYELYEDTKESPAVDKETRNFPEDENSQDRYGFTGSSCTESPGIASHGESQEDDDDDDNDFGFANAGDEKVAYIEEEFVERIASLERRHHELEDVLARLMTAIEFGLMAQANQRSYIPSRDIEEDDAAEGNSGKEKNTDDKDVTDNDREGLKEQADQQKEERNEDDEEETDKKEAATDMTRSLSIELFIEFQRKIRNFAEDLNGVLNCSESAIRHARIIQEWATSVQMMFEQMREERSRTQHYIDEREKTMMLAREQFIAELERQGRQLQQLVDDLVSYKELKDRAQDYIRTKKRGSVERIIDQLLKTRLEEDRSIILSLSKQSKISELRLFVIHQQSCIQQLQEQNRELRAIIEGLMGPEELEDEETSDTDQSSTPASGATPERCPIRDVLNKRDSSRISQVSEVLNCDRGEYLPGTSTYGDLATVQAYKLGRSDEELHRDAEEDNAVFDPLSISYVREQCRLAEETERRANLECEEVKRKAQSPEVCENQGSDLDPESENNDVVQDIEPVTAPDQDDVIDVDQEHVEPSQRTPAEQRFIDERCSMIIAAGDGADVTNRKEASTETPDQMPEHDEPHVESIVAEN